MSREVLPTTTMSGIIRAIRTTLEAHAWPSPITQIGFRGPTDLIQSDPAELSVATPAMYLTIGTRRGAESTERPQAPPRSGRIERTCTFQIYCLLSQTTPDVPIEIYEMSESVASLIERREYHNAPRLGHRWGLSAAVGYPRLIEDAEPDLGIHGIAARVIQWDQVVYLPELSPINEPS